MDRTQFAEEATRLAIESVEKGWGGPFGASLEDTSKIGFDDAFQYEDFKLSWEQRKNITVVPNFERERCLAAYRAWENKKDRHPY